jgi:hypothetical protein
MMHTHFLAWAVLSQQARQASPAGAAAGWVEIGTLGFDLSKIEPSRASSTG